MPQNNGGRYPDSWGGGPQQPQRPQQVSPGQGGSPGGSQQPPQPPQPPQPEEGPSRGRRAGVAVLIAVAVLALIGLGAALALLRPWESDDTDTSAAGQAELSTVGTTTHGAPSTAASSSKSPSTSTRATDAPEGMSRTGFDGGMSCRGGDRWVYAAQAPAGQVLICDGGSGLYYLDNFGQGPWRTEVTRHSGDDHFEMTTRATTIYIDGDRLWVDSEGQITRTDDFYEVHTAD